MCQSPSGEWQNIFKIITSPGASLSNSLLWYIQKSPKIWQNILVDTKWISTAVTKLLRHFIQIIILFFVWNHKMMDDYMTIVHFPRENLYTYI